MTTDIIVAISKQMEIKKEVLISRLNYNKIDRTYNDYANDVIISVANSDQLQKCTVDSIVNSAFQLAKVGLTIGGNIGWLVPYAGKCNFQIGYEGYAILLSRSINIKYKIYDVIYESDKFDISDEEISTDEKGNISTLAKFTLKRGKNKDKIIGAFSYILLADGNSYALYLSKKNIDDKYKQSSSSSNFWGKWDEHMYAKQVYKVLSRKLLKMYCNTNTDIIEIMGDDENNDFKVANAKTIIQSDEDFIDQNNIIKPELSIENKAILDDFSDRGSPASEQNLFENQLL